MKTAYSRVTKKPMAAPPRALKGVKKGLQGNLAYRNSDKFHKNLAAEGFGP